MATVTPAASGAEVVIKQAIFDRIQEKVDEKKIPLLWRLETVYKMHGKKMPKPIRKPLSKEAMITQIKIAGNAVLDNLLALSTKELKAVVKGENTAIFAPIHSIKFSALSFPKSEQQEEEYADLLIGLPESEMWKFLELVTKFDREEIYKEAAEKGEKSRAAKKSGYTSVTNEEAVSILASYYKQLASSASAVAPECYRKGGVSNVTNAFRRLQYSFHNQDDCRVFNSVPNSVYEYWKENKGDTMNYEKDKAVIDAYIAANPDHLEKVKSWCDAPYIAAVRKK